MLGLGAMLSGGAISAPGALTLTLDASENNVKVRERLNFPSGKRTVTVSILAGVEIGSTSTGEYAIDVQDGWDAETDFIFDFNGETDNRVQGKGGRGGRGAADDGTKVIGAGGGAGGGAGRHVGGAQDGGARGVGPGAAADGADGTKDAAGAGGAGTTDNPGFDQVQEKGRPGGGAIHLRGFDAEIIGGKVYAGAGGGAGGGVNEAGGDGGAEGQAGVDTASATGGAAGDAITTGGGMVTQTNTPDIKGAIN